MSNNHTLTTTAATVVDLNYISTELQIEVGFQINFNKSSEYTHTAHVKHLSNPLEVRQQFRSNFGQLEQHCLSFSGMVVDASEMLPKLFYLCCIQSVVQPAAK